MTRWSALAHRRLDHAAAEAEARDGGEVCANFAPGALLPRTRDRTRDMRSMDRKSGPLLKAAKLWAKTSQRTGRTYYERIALGSAERGL